MPVRRAALLALGLCAGLAAAAVPAAEVNELEAGRQAIFDGDYARALRLLQPLAEQGDAGAQVALGAMYAQGLGVPLDLEVARGWFSKSAAQGNEKARSNLLYMADGFLYPRDGAPRCRDALSIITELASLQYAAAYTAAGNLLFEGCGEVAPQPAEGVGWWRMAAAGGDPVAQTNLGVAYASGRGVERDYAAALEWYRKAAAQGHAAAQFGLGTMYEHGEGVASDPDEARHWYELAAAGGDERAREQLGSMTGEP
jgi:TPR repeat protein